MKLSHLIFAGIVGITIGYQAPVAQAAEGGVVAQEYQEAFGEHAFDSDGNYIGPTEVDPATEAAWAEYYENLEGGEGAAEGTAAPEAPEATEAAADVTEAVEAPEAEAAPEEA
mgnify:CR=1 FL=1